MTQATRWMIATEVLSAAGTAGLRTLGQTALWGTQSGPCKAVTRFGKERQWRGEAMRGRRV